MWSLFTTMYYISRNLCFLFKFADDPISEIYMTSKYFISLKIVRITDKSATFKSQYNFLKDQKVQFSKIK